MMACSFCCGSELRVIECHILVFLSSNFVKQVRYIIFEGRSTASALHNAGVRLMSSGCQHGAGWCVR